MIDWDRVAELKEEVGVEDFDEVIELFLEEVDAVIDRLTSSRDVSNLEEDLHFIKGSALNLGFDALGKLCQVGEKEAAAGNSETVDVDVIVDTYRTSLADFMKDAVA